MNCNICMGGLVKVGSGYNRCECQREKVAKKLFEFSEAPRKFLHFKEELNDQKVLSSLNEKTSYIELLDNLTDEQRIENLFDHNMSIVLKGNPGSGKTQMAVTLALEIMKSFNLYAKELKTHRFFFLDARGINGWMYRSNNNDNEKERILEKIRKSDVLIIDDLGSELHNNADVLRTLDQAIREFSGVKIITTNMNEEIKHFYDSKDKRLADVLVNTEEKNHKKHNTLFYYVVLNKSRRVMEIDEDIGFV